MEHNVWKKFAENEITHSAAHYLMAIDELHQNQGYARLIDISNKLKISKGSLSTSLKSLIDKNLVMEDKNKHFSLSEKGLSYARRIHETAIVIKKLLTRLGVNSHIAKIDACKIEHLLSPQASNGLSKLVSILETHHELLDEMKNKK